MALKMAQTKKSSSFTKPWSVYEFKNLLCSNDYLSFFFLFFKLTFKISVWCNSKWIIYDYATYKLLHFIQYA